MPSSHPLLTEYGRSVPISIHRAVAAVLSLIAVRASRETACSDLTVDPATQRVPATSRR